MSTFLTAHARPFRAHRDVIERERRGIDSQQRNVLSHMITEWQAAREGIKSITLAATTKDYRTDQQKMKNK